MEPDDSLLLDFSENYKSASCAFWRSILGFLSDAFVARNVLSLDWLFYLGSYQEPDHRGHHFFLRNHAAIFSRLGSVHPSGCYLHHARFVGLFLRHRTHGDILAGHNRYSANRSLREHDHCDADAHLPGISIPQMEALINGLRDKEAADALREENWPDSDWSQCSRPDRADLISRCNGEFLRLQALRALGFFPRPEIYTFR